MTKYKTGTKGAGMRKPYKKAKQARTRPGPSKAMLRLKEKMLLLSSRIQALEDKVKKEEKE